jgi:hypothetical protein
LDFNNNDHELTVPGPTVNGAIHFGQAMNIYVPPGTTVFATFEVFPLAPNGGRCFMTINGFLAPQQRRRDFISQERTIFASIGRSKSIASF